MSSKIIFLNTGWMKDYCGLSNDSIIGGGKHVKEEGWGGEIFNFMDFKDFFYGYAEIWGRININRLGAGKDDESIDNVTIVWTANRPDTGGTYIIGWYKNAVLYREVQENHRFTNRKYRNNKIGYVTKANKENCRLLNVDERIINVPRKQKGVEGMGQRNIWYAEKNPDFVEKTLKYIYNGVNPFEKEKIKRKLPTTARQPNQEKKIEVEKEAIKIITQHYENIFYKVNSVEKENKGWDLEADLDKIKLFLEVKGLSGTELNVELTPNEYSNLRRYKYSYRLCIVTEVLTNPNVHIFSYSIETDSWEDDKENSLKFEEIVKAKAFLKV